MQHRHPDVMSLAAAGTLAREPELAEREVVAVPARAVAAADPWFVERYGELAGEAGGPPRASAIPQ